MRIARKTNSVPGRYFTESGKERGAVLVVTAFMFIALLGVTALVVDIVTLHQARLKAQATADAAVLAAAYDLGEPGWQGIAANAAKEYAARNFDVTPSDWAKCQDSEPIGPTIGGSSCISVDDDTNPTEIRVRIPDRKVPAFFATVLGRSGFAVSAAASAELVVTVAGPAPGDEFNGSVRSGVIAGYPPCDDPEFWDLGEFVPYSYQERDKKGNLKYNKDGSPKITWVTEPISPWREFIIVFQHTDGTTTTVCGSNRHGTATNEANLAWTGGDTKEGTAAGMDVHVSCSENFKPAGYDDGDFDLSDPLVGWDQKGRSPNPATDPEWRILTYQLDARVGDGNVPDSDPNNKPKAVEDGADFSTCENVNLDANPPTETIIQLSD